MSLAPPHRIAVTMGDPSGIGPEIVVKALAALPEFCPRVVVCGDEGALDAAGGVPAAVVVASSTVLPGADRTPGKPTLAGGRAQVAYLEAAVELAKQGAAAAIVTAPVSKTQAQKAGFAFAGHTDFFAERFGASKVHMMFAGARLNVVLATVHIPLRQVAASLTVSSVCDAVVAGATSMVSDFGLQSPRIGVLGLNPHAGEAGLFGDEEPLVIAPAILQARQQLADAAIFATVSGPLVPDAAFRHAADGQYDLLVAMYHDQALIPVKLIDFNDAVNITLGLPIVRTSVDHGVAYDIAGTGSASPQSLLCALRLAGRILRHM